MLLSLMQTVAQAFKEMQRQLALSLDLCVNINITIPLRAMHGLRHAQQAVCLSHPVPRPTCVHCLLQVNNSIITPQLRGGTATSCMAQHSNG